MAEKLPFADVGFQNLPDEMLFALLNNRPPSSAGDPSSPFNMQVTSDPLPLTFNQRLELEDLINKLLGPEDFRPLPVDPNAPGVFELLPSGKQNPHPFKLL